MNNIKVIEENNKVIYRDENQWFDEMNNNAFRGIMDTIRNMGLEVFNNFKNDVVDGLQQFRCDEGFVFNMPVIYTICEK